MNEENGISGTGIEATEVSDPIQPEQSDPPVQATEEQKAEEQTPEQQEEKRQSRRERARARDAAKLAEAQTEARMLREQLDRQQAKAAPVTDSEPQRESFDTLEDYHRALARHEARQEASKLIEGQRKAQTEQEQKARTEASDAAIAKSWESSEVAFRKEATDYDEVVGEFIAAELPSLDANAKRAILESDIGPKLLYHLAKNPEEAERIAKLSPVRQVIEIGKMEERVVPVKQGSKAPPPVSGVKGSSAIQNYREDMSDAQYKAYRKATGAKWAQ
jgi:membrane protein involved in colicin uptake